MRGYDAGTGRPAAGVAAWNWTQTRNTFAKHTRQWNRKNMEQLRANSGITYL